MLNSGQVFVVFFSEEKFDSLDTTWAVYFFYSVWNVSAWQHTYHGKGRVTEKVARILKLLRIPKNDICYVPGS